MAEKRIKFRLFHYYEETTTASGPLLAERSAMFGETVDISRPEDIARGEDLGAFFTDAELKAIDKGTYQGPEAELLRRDAAAARGGESDEGIETLEIRPPVAPLEPESGRDGGGEMDNLDLSDMDSAEIAEIIESRELNVRDTVKLAGDDPALAEKVLDAEGIVASNKGGEMRSGVDKGLQAVIDRGSGDGT